MAKFEYYWEEEEIISNPYYPDVVLFGEELNEEERLQRAIKLLETDDVYVFTVLIYDFIDAFRGSERRTYERFQLYMKHSWYANKLYEKAIVSLKGPGVNASYMDRIDHVAILEEYMPVFFKPKDIDVLIDILKREEVYSFFHYKAFLCLAHFLDSGNQAHKDFLLGMLSKTMYLENRLLELKKGDNNGIEYETEYCMTTICFLMRYSIDDALPLITESVFSKEIIPKYKFIGLSYLSENTNKNVKRQLLNQWNKILEVLFHDPNFNKGDYWVAESKVINDLFNPSEEFISRIVNADNDWGQEFNNSKGAIEDSVDMAGQFGLEEFLKLPLRVLQNHSTNQNLRRLACEKILYARTQIYNYYNSPEPELTGKYTEALTTFLEEQKGKLSEPGISNRERENIQKLLQYADKKLNIPVSELKNKNLLYQWYRLS